MSLHSIKDLNKLNDPMKQFQVKFYLSQGVSKIMNLITTGKNILYEEEFELRCTSFSLPGIKMAQDEIVLGNHAIQRPTYQDRSGVFSVKVVEDVNAEILMGVHNWMNRITDTATGVRASSSTYIATACIEFDGSHRQHLGGISGATRKAMAKVWNDWLNADKLFGGPTDTVKLYLHGVYPIALKPTTIDTSSSNAIEWEIDFNVDWFGEDNTII